MVSNSAILPTVDVNERLLSLVQSYAPPEYSDLQCDTLIPLIRQAMHHRSYANSMNNERLEYLGDAVIGLIVADYLIKRYPDQDEGFLTEMRSRIVNGDRLNYLAICIGIDGLLWTSRPIREMSRRIMGDALEALVGAIFLSLGFAFVSKWFIKLIETHIDFAPLIHSLITSRSIHKYCGAGAGICARRVSKSQSGLTTHIIECISRRFAFI